MNGEPKLIGAGKVNITFIVKEVGMDFVLPRNEKIIQRVKEVFYHCFPIKRQLEYTGLR